MRGRPQNTLAKRSRVVAIRGRRFAILPHDLILAVLLVEVDAPYSVVISNLGDKRTATAAACAAGLVTVGTEMRGAGTVSPDALAICRRGVRNVLAHLRLIEQEEKPAPSASRPILELRGPPAYVYASADGVFEPEDQPVQVLLQGLNVKAGQVFDELLDLGWLRGDFGIDLLQLVEDR